MKYLDIFHKSDKGKKNIVRVEKKVDEQKKK